MNKSLRLIKHIRDTARAEIDYLQLMGLLAGYANPRDKVRRLLASGELIRVKKGLYVLNPDVTNIPYNRESLANLIYGPSAVSLESALSFYGLIPERVEEVTSITPKRRRLFNTVVGRFSYEHLHSAKFATGIDQVEHDPPHFILIATPEKALCDLLTIRVKIKLETTAELFTALEEDMRVDTGLIKQLSKSRLRELVQVYKSSSVDLLEKLRREM